MIYCILGMTGTGKTTIARKVAKELQIPLIVSYTSRPIRPGEKEDVDYHYVDNQHFDENKDDFIEMREYEVYDGSIWKYGYKKSSFSDKKKDYLVVIETEGYKAFKDYFGKDKIKPILINSQIGDLYLRLQKRGDNPKEIERRIEDDKHKFEYFAENEECENVYNYYDLDFAVKQTIHKITNNGGKQ